MSLQVEIWFPASSFQVSSSQNHKTYEYANIYVETHAEQIGGKAI